MNVRCVGRRCRQPRLQLLLTSLQRLKPVEQRIALATLLDRVEHFGNIARHARQLGTLGCMGCPPLLIEPIALAYIGVDRLGRRFGRHQAFLQAIEYASFERFPGDAVAVAAARIIRSRRAAEATLEAERERATTDAAEDKARQQRLRTMDGVQTICRASRRDCSGELKTDGGLPRLDRLPERIVDDAKLGNLGRDPFFLGIDPRHALAGAGVLYVALPVPHELADIKRVVEKAGAAADMTAQRRSTPELAGRARDTIRVQAQRDVSRAHAIGEVTEYAPDDGGFRLVDGAFTGHGITGAVEPANYVIAVAQATARFALLDAAAHSAMRLLRQILQEQRVHRALQPDMQFADLALGQCDELYACELEMFVERCDVRLVARYAVQGFRQHDIEAATLGILQQPLDAGAQRQRRARDRGIPIGADDLRAVSCRLLATNAKLIVDRRRALLVGGIAGVEGGTGHRACLQISGAGKTR